MYLKLKLVGGNRGKEGRKEGETCSRTAILTRLPKGIKTDQKGRSVGSQPILRASWGEKPT